MIEFFVEGKPVPKHRPRFANKNGKVIAYTPAKTKAYEMAIGLKAKEARNNAEIFTPLQKDVTVEIIAFTQSIADLDNIVKSVLDGMNKIIYEDDRQVTSLVCKRITVPHGVEKTWVKVTNA